VLELPYATFTYNVTGYRIVPSNRIEVLVSNRTERLALQACHPRFMAAKRYIVYARPVLVTGFDGRTIVAASSG
jgi:sortase (surface protein transpeptidase)